MPKDTNKNKGKNNTARTLSKYTTVSQLSDYINDQTAQLGKLEAKGQGSSKKAKQIRSNIKAAQKKMGSDKTQTNKSFDILGNWGEKPGQTYDQDTVDAFLREAATHIDRNTNDLTRITNMMTSSLTGIEGMPYQFMSTVDRRLTSTTDPTDNDGIGRKFGEKILSRFPLLFVQPCTVNFMKGFNTENKTTVAQAMLTGDVPANFEELLSQNGRFYEVEMAYAEYYRYFNCMMNALAIYLGIGHVQVKIGDKIQKLRSARWQNEANADFKSYFSAKENLVFYTDGFSSVSQSFGNDTGDSSLASTLNGFSDQINEIKFLFGTDGGVVSEVAGMASEVTSSITSGLSAAMGKLGGGIVESLAKNGVNTILNGGKIIFPEIWSNSSMDDGSASFDFKFRSPDNDTLSIYLNVLKPYCKWLCLTMPHQAKNASGDYDQNSYSAPFVLKSALKGKFSVDTGIVASLSVTKGAECQWNDDGLPTQIDISVDIKNLYKNMAISTYDQKTWTIVNNTAYMDFIANMAGLNILQQDLWRKEKYFIYLTGAQITGIPTNIFTHATQGISRIVGNIYDLTS